MNRFHTKLLGLMVIMAIVFQSCDTNCKNVTQEELGGEFFTVEYLDSTGTNYLTDIYNQTGVIVYLDTAGGADALPEFELITPGFEDGRFGPFYFTERYIDAASEQINNVLLFNQTFKFDYYIKKDTYGEDTLSVEFLLSASECGYAWNGINYSLNGEPLPEYKNQKDAAIVIVE